ncbi:PREDICTED: high affinity immunoglobulin gamma Fc receptor I-like isoform X1 [Cyprinodon variegatus]|uniref:high affinity immunoglobulin gamma Fc receptor I-like isoform X1 n=1 Tax=Cyprinodon variegatus TaxID=28743 RepID=UPI000742B1E5|nr:PREDICTED: high affinity immunoglobulin gamma Fc receptor I-like isoform X1 [Cyprinodon variegatus]
MLVTPLCLMLTCLKVSPDRSQFFRYESISLSCEDPLNSTDWKVKRNTSDSGVRLCSSGWGFASSGFSCIIGNTYPTDTGVYWCESDGQERSNVVNITITDRTVILESPVMPVSEGAPVVLRCKAEKNSSNHKYNFYKDGRIIRSKTSGEMIIFSASRSDEGLYTCSASGLGESEGSWLTVLGDWNDQQIQLTPGTLSSSAPPTAPISIPASRLLCHLIVGIPYLVSTILLGLIYRDRKRAARMVDKRENVDIIMERIV